MAFQSFRRRSLVHAASAAVVAAVLASAWSRPAAQSGAQSACAIETTQRVVAVGDVHGAYQQFIAILRSAGIIDGRDRWIGGRALLVQTGDVVDRGADSRRALDLLRRLERDAPRAGGRVYALLGNHEVMRMAGDWRYVSAGEYAAFRTIDSEDLREGAYQIVAADAARRARDEGRSHDEATFRDTFMREIPLGFIEMQRAFGASGEYGQWLRSHNTLVKINDIVFLHGGVNTATAAMGCEAINETVRREIAGTPPPEAVASTFASSDTGPLWYRGLAEEPEPAFAPELAAILGKLGARAIVIGHTVAPGGRIATRFNSRVFQIDTGMIGGSFYPGGAASALEIHGDRVTAIYADRRETLHLPAALETPEAAR